MTGEVKLKEPMDGEIYVQPVKKSLSLLTLVKKEKLKINLLGKFAQ